MTDLYDALPFVLPPEPRFDGPDVGPTDAQRLAGQMMRVWSVIQSGEWLTLGRIQELILAEFGNHDQPQSISARLRDLRKKRFGSHNIERRNLGDGLFAYRLDT